MVNRISTVSDIIFQVKSTLESGFRSVLFEGEITNLSSSAAGHWYFSLSDSQAMISGALFKMDALRNPLIRKLKDGDKVQVQGSIGVYAKRGSFQVIVKQITAIGKGDLKEQFELLKKKLAGDGLFDLENKVEIPSMPKKIAVITAKKAAALQDFLNICSRRGHWMDVTVVPAFVQGDHAPKSLRHALNKAIKYSLENPDKAYDVIVLTRGGGSLEDLWAFNDEALAWDIYNCPIPVISAVGHQVDYSISDFVSDLRCETPSAAAEIITQRQTQISSLMIDLKAKLFNSIQSLIGSYQLKIEKGHPRVIIETLYSRVNQFQKKLNRLNITDRLHELTRIHELNMGLDDAVSRIERAIVEKCKNHGQNLDKQYELLRTLNPSNILGRGYSFVTDDNGNVVSNLKEFKSVDNGSKLAINFTDGTGSVVKDNS